MNDILKKKGFKIPKHPLYDDFVYEDELYADLVVDFYINKLRKKISPLFLLNSNKLLGYKRSEPYIRYFDNTCRYVIYFPIKSYINSVVLECDLLDNVKNNNKKFKIYCYFNNRSMSFLYDFYKKETRLIERNDNGLKVNEDDIKLFQQVLPIIKKCSNLFSGKAKQTQNELESIEIDELYMEKEVILTNLQCTKSIYISNKYYTPYYSSDKRCSKNYNNLRKYINFQHYRILYIVLETGDIIFEFIPEYYYHKMTKKTTFKYTFVVKKKDFNNDVIGTVTDNTRSLNCFESILSNTDEYSFLYSQIKRLIEIENRIIDFRVKNDIEFELIETRSHDEIMMETFISNLKKKKWKHLYDICPPYVRTRNDNKCE